jgi:hypothetical protein
MERGPGWLPDPEEEDQERYWSGSLWTDRVRPAGTGRSFQLAGHAPELQRALAAGTADIEAVEERLSNLFDRTAGRPVPPAGSGAPSVPTRPHDAGAPIADGDAQRIEFEEDPIDVEVEAAADEPVHAEFTEPPEPDEEDDAAAFAELDAALATEEPEEAPRGRGLFRRRS